MSSLIATRLSAIRTEMAKNDLDAFIIPRADEYLGEYVPEHNERLCWATHFSGSAGMAIILKAHAAIFIDGRYTVQVRQQVDGNLFDYLSLTDTPQIQWLIDTLPASSRVGIDTRLHSFTWYQAAQSLLNNADITLVPLTENPIDCHWENRPQASTAPAILFSEQYAGETSVKKRARIAEKVKQAGADVALITALDSFCWLLNLRGQDVPRLPVILGTALLHNDGCLELFTDVTKLPKNIQEHVGIGVNFSPEAQLQSTLAALSNKTLLADPLTSNAWSQLLAQSSGITLLAASDPIALAKAQKNMVELAGFKACHVRDGVAVSRFLAWLDNEVSEQHLYDEAQLADKLESYRLQDPLYQEPSFDTISAVGSNAAMCHYNHNNGTPTIMALNSLYLVDSGAQYFDGTTDVTRTIAIGDVSAEHKKMVTLVLKGHIALDQAKFPLGTTGQQLDAFARQFLWQHGYDYDHGTGHGVGHFLNVHEGPQRIAKAGHPVPLLPGMIVSNEPGYYRENAFGIRLENLVAVKRCETLKHSKSQMLEFEALTLIPMDTRLIDKSLLTVPEIHWLNDYHQKVFQALSPFMQENELNWLTNATQAV
ncbi:aminopeptidase P family protein [Shewanella surugensis]|uniref:Aminopeptidase P family protein n=1 Tax=Shewanella surugensis TaxID=212020 RepID=A0ABT0L8C6_9GAMM|nr:aminopeptidase P family protein [Shewanella surugensis]MCL1123804.1 aminopeptidase P family protein [Shewanella surugensis]